MAEMVEWFESFWSVVTISHEELEIMLGHKFFQERLFEWEIPKTNANASAAVYVVSCSESTRSAG